MSITETPDAPAEPKPKKRHARANRKPKPEAKPSVFAGISVKNCPDACFASGKCVISGSICSHPHKGGLQATLHTPERLARLAEAKRVLGKKMLDLTGTE